MKFARVVPLAEYDLPKCAVVRTNEGGSHIRRVCRSNIPKERPHYTNLRHQHQRIGSLPVETGASEES